jgi:hypothetical protein
MFNGLKIKTNSIKLSSFFGGAAIAAATLALTAGNASAGTLSFQVATQYGSTDVEYDIKITDLAANAGVQVSVNQSATSPNSADLLGLFFNLTPGNASNFGITSSSFTKISGDDITKVCFIDNECDSGNNVKGDLVNALNVAVGSKNFDIGLQLGSTGSSGGLVKSSVFSIASSSLTTANFLNQAFAVRAQSAGINGDGSVKELGYAGSAIDTPPAPAPAPAPVPAAVPEPLTILGAATAAGFGASFKRRLAKVKGNQKAD